VQERLSREYNLDLIRVRRHPVIYQVTLIRRHWHGGQSGTFA